MQIPDYKDMLKIDYEHGLYESTLDDDAFSVEEGYGLRGQALQQVLSIIPINDINQLGAKWLPSTRGKVPGLGMDTFFDLVMAAKNKQD